MFLLLVVVRLSNVITLSLASSVRDDNLNPAVIHFTRPGNALLL